MVTNQGITSLARLDAARTALAEARSLDDILQIRDVAEMARSYARAAKLGLDSQNYAAEIKLRAERKAGELLRQMPKNKGEAGQFTGGCMMQLPGAPTYSDLGIEKTQAHR